MLNRFLCYSLGAFFALSIPHQAVAHNVCTVLKSPDGFVALRDRPSPKGKLLVKMHPDDFVVIDTVGGFDWITSGHWYRVLHYAGGPEFPEPNEPEYKKVKHGWVHERYVGECG